MAYQCNSMSLQTDEVPSYAELNVPLLDKHHQTVSIKPNRNSTLGQFGMESSTVEDESMDSKTTDSQPTVQTGEESSFIEIDSTERQLAPAQTEEDGVTIDSPTTCIEDTSADSQTEDKEYNPRQSTINCDDIEISYDLSPCSSTLTAIYPICRICQNGGEKGNRLITPCRCNGTLKYVHGSCLRKWIEVRCRYKKYEFPEQCELCGYEYRKRKYIKCRKWKLPRMDARDKIYHMVSLASLCIMVVCLVLSIYCILLDTNSGVGGKYKLETGEKYRFTVGELVTLSSGIVFFLSFILAMTVEIKSRHTIFEVIKRMLRYNTVWVIENYNKALDTDSSR